VLDCALYPHLSGYRDQIQSFNLQNGQYIVAVNATQFNSPTSTSSFVMQLCPQYLEPLVKVEKFGITNSGTMESHEIVSLPNMFVSSDTKTPTITINFYWKLFELMRKRYVRPERTPENGSSNALLLELSKMDDEAIMKDQQTRMTNRSTPHSPTTFLPSRCPFRYSISHYSSQVGTWIILH
jgi:hypothetical protein